MSTKNKVHHHWKKLDKIDVGITDPTLGFVTGGDGTV